jgi:dihydrofolate reductase
MSFGGLYVATDMRTVVSHTIVTLDGVAVFDSVADTVVELRDTPEVLDEFFAKVAEEDAMLLGRVTYEEWVDHWSGATEGQFAPHINSVPKYVVSRSLEAAPWGAHDPATVIGGDLTEEITRLKEETGGRIGVHGSPTLVDGLLQADLLDELRLEVYPVVAGIGARLFKDGGAPKRLRLAESRATESGVVILTYRRPT